MQSKETDNDAVGRTVAIRNQDQERCRGRAEEEVTSQYERQQTLVVVSSQDWYGSLFTERIMLQVKDTQGSVEIAFERIQVQLVFSLPSKPEVASVSEGRESGKPERTSFCAQCCTGSCDPCSGCKVRHVLESPNLRRVRDQGVEVIRAYLFPLFSKHGREVVSLLQLCTAIAMLVFALPTFVNEAREGYIPTTDIVRLSISLVSIFLAAIDAGFALYIYRCALCKTLVAAISSRCCCKPKRGPHEEPNPPRAQNSTKEKLSTVGKFDKYFNDIIRLLLAEALLYPTIICNVLDNASGRTYQGTASEKFTFARFILSAVWLIVHVYLFRLIVIGVTIVHLEMVRRAKVKVLKYNPRTEEKPTPPQETWEDPHAKRRAFRGMVLEIFFLVHVFGQMLTQGLMIGAIWSKIECENPVAYVEATHTIYLSPFTWVMVVLGFVLPIAGTFTFFIPTYFWAQEFPGDFIMGMLSALKKRDLANFKQGGQEIADKLTNFLKKMDSSNVTKERNFFQKLFYPVYSPRLIFFSCVYDVVLLTFAIFYGIGYTGQHHC